MWKTVKLGEICELNYGKALDKKDRVENGIIPAYGANGIKAFANKPLYDKPSILIGRKGSAGEINKVVEPFWALDVTYYVTTDGSIVDLDFLFYALTTLNLPSMARGVKPGINRNDVYDRSINLPPLAEQQRIVAKLDAAFAEIDEIIEQTEQKLHQAKLLMQKVIDENIGFESSDTFQTKLDDFCDIKHGFAFEGKSFSLSDDESKPIVLTPGNFSENGTTKFNRNNTKRLQTIYDEKLLFSLNDLVVVMTDLSSKMPLLGKPAFIKQSNILHNQRIGLVQNNEQVIVNEYLYFYFQSTDYLNEIKKTASGTMVRHTAPKRILSNTIKAPQSLSQQREISQKIKLSLSTLENLINIYRNKISNSVALKSAILAQELQSEAA